MPFGLTGTPSTFAHMTTTRMHDLIVKETLELFVDDSGTAADTFEEMMEKLTKIFTLVRENGLSLSASKCELFMTTMVFAGASVGPMGVQPDLSKLTAIINWKTPEDALALAGFLGLTGWFRDLILGYAKKEKPLRDLLRNQKNHVKLQAQKPLDHRTHKGIPSPQNSHDIRTSTERTQV